jgi:hypothetical protein
VRAGQRYVLPLAQQQLAALNRLSSKKAADRRTWLEGLLGPLAPNSSSLACSSSATALLLQQQQQLPQQLPQGGFVDASGLLGGAVAGVQHSGGSGSSSSGAAGPLLPSGLEVSGMLSNVRGRVLPPPHLAYSTPECAYPGSQVRCVLRAGRRN